MLFNSLTFIVFFAILLGLHYTISSWRARKLVLLIGSYLFYAAWNPPFVILLWISTAIDWWAAKRLGVETGKKSRLALVLLSVAVNLGLLGFFKYGGFVLENFVALMTALGVDFVAAKPNIILPVGISFYTFQTMSYTLDVYKKTAKPSKSFLDFALYVTFFPQLVAGPIVRATHFLPQLVTPKRATRDQLGWGLFLMTLGMFQKVVLADAFLAPAAESVFGFSHGPVNMLDSWLGVLAFSGQIFCDFAGYSTCAIGAALCLGFSLPNNFRFPYAAVGFADFWRRWHISLSTWLRDYLYIGMGGNRLGNIRTYVNLMVTMLIGGLWHGASWTFVAWGGLHGIYLVIERLLVAWFGRPSWTKTGPMQLVLGLVTFVMVLITWVFFRAQDFPSAMLLLVSMFGVVAEGAVVLTTLSIFKVVFVMTGLLAAHWWMRNRSLEEVAGSTPGWLRSLVWASMLILLILTQGGGSAFIYFQF